MKRILIFLLLTGVVLGAFAQSGTIQELTGEVELKPAGTAVFSQASVGAVINLDTIISTGFRSTAIIAVGSSVITVRPLTRLTLTEIQSSAGTETINVNLQAGRLRVDVKPPAGTKANFTVQSPSATASVRGTSFDIDIMNTKVLEGKVAYGKNNGKPSQIPAGFQSNSGTWGKVEDYFTVSSSNLQTPVPVGTGSTWSKGNSFSASEAELDIIINYPVN